MAVRMAVIKVGEEVEVGMMTDATHVATGILQRMILAGMAIIIEVVDVLVRAPGLQTGITDRAMSEIAVIAMSEKAARDEMFAAAMRNVVEVGARRVAKLVVMELHL